MSQFTRLCRTVGVGLAVATATQAKTQVAYAGLRGAPESITTDNGGEFAGQAMDAWAHRVGVKLDFIQPGGLHGDEK